MKQALDEAFARYGLAAAICRGEEKEAVKAFIQPMMRETGEEPFDATPLGAAAIYRWAVLKEETA